MIRLMFFSILFLAGFTTGCTTDGGNKAESEPAVQAVVFVEGEDYQVLDAPLVSADSPVIEFFYYGCKACYSLVPAVAEWRNKTGNQVSLVPVHSKTKLMISARLFHTFAEMKLLSKMYEVGYEIFQTKESSLTGKERIDDYLLKNDINKKQFWSIWRSDAVNKRMSVSLALTQKAKVTMTPSFVVQGRYLVQTQTIDSVENLLDLLSFLSKKDV